MDNGNVGTYSPKNSKYVSGESVSSQGKALMPLACGATASSAGTIPIGINSTGRNLLVSSNTNPNMWSTAYLCDTDDDGPWNDYKVGTASWAMGAPTNELYAASYNTTHSNNQITMIIDENGQGYYSNVDGSALLISSSEYGGIYNLTYAGYWWLGGPGYNSFSNRAGIDANGHLGDLNCYQNNSLRPVVCLQKANFTYDLAAQDW